MKYLLMIAIFLIVFSLTASTILPAYAERTSVFQKIERFIDEPFLSIEKAVGGHGHKRLHAVESSEPLKPFMTSWICQILVGDIGKMFGTDNPNTVVSSNICKS